VSARWRLATTILLLSAIGFGVNAHVATELDRRAAFADWDTLFGSDPNWYLRRLTDGTYSSKRHPLLGVLVHQPARAIGAVAAASAGADERAARRRSVLLASPLAGAARTALLIALCVTIGTGLRFAALIALLDIASLSRLIFGSMPESYAATAVALTWMFYLTARALKAAPGAPISAAAWLACGIFGTGVTLTNIVPFAILLFAVYHARGLGWSRAALRSGRLAGSVLIAIVMLHVASLALVQPDPPVETRAATAPASAGAPIATPRLENLSPFVRFRPLAIVRQLPLIATATFVGPPPAIDPRPPLPSGQPHARAQFRMPTTSLTPAWAWCVAMVTLAVGVGIAGARSASPWRPLFRANAAILAFNLALFTLWGGGNIFMFTLHWQPCLLLVFAAGPLATGRMRTAAAATLVAFVAMAIVWNATFLHTMWQAL